MSNYEYVRSKIYGSTRKFSEAAEELFAARNKIEQYNGVILDWLARDYGDIALDYPVGTLVQWNEDCFDCSSEENRRKGIYGIVIRQSTREDSLNVIHIKTTDRTGRPMEKVLWIPGDSVKKADIPNEIVTIIRDSFGNKL